MSAFRLVALAGLIPVMFGAAGADEATDPVASLLAAHNRERAKEKKGALKLSALLCLSSEVHARDMAAHQKMEHIGSDGSSAADRVKRAGYVYVRVGENIAEGQTDVDEVMTSWMNSPPHRMNILSDYSEMGAAVVSDDWGKPYWCVNFGIPMLRLEPDQAAAAVFKLMNVDRAKNQRPELKAEPGLGRAAMAISAAMAAQNRLDIDEDPFKLIDADAIKGRELRLRLCSGASSAEEATKSLLGDTGDELKDFGEVGIGYALSKTTIPYWCALFSKPTPPDPSGAPKDEKGPAAGAEPRGNP